MSQLYSTRLSQILATHEMTVGQFGILNHLSRDKDNQSLRISDIARAVEVNQPAVTKAIARFESAGLVELSDDTKDKRAKRVQLSTKGQNHLAQVYHSIGPGFSGLFEQFDTAALDQLTGHLKSLGRWLDENRLP